MSLQKTKSQMLSSGLSEGGRSVESSNAANVVLGEREGFVGALIDGMHDGGGVSRVSEAECVSEFVQEDVAKIDAARAADGPEFGCVEMHPTFFGISAVGDDSAAAVERFVITVIPASEEDVDVDGPRVGCI